ncbi:unnamed protein product [Symbiodinium microadriaticum]|nr:unnamed protein product [Symbiodinium microadriaticum]
MGVLDNLHSKHLSLTAAEGGVLKDAAWNIIEAFQLAGACSVVCPLWGGGSTGGDLGQLARLLLLMRFYFELPNFAHTGRPVASALQQTQNWLRNASIDDVLEFLQNAPIPEKCCEELYVEVSSFKKAKSKASAGGSSLPTHHDDGGAVKLFGHFFYWGMLIAVGDCRNVHPAGVGGSMDEGIDRNKRGVRRPVGGATSLRPQQQVEECEEDDDVVGLYAGVGVEDDDEEGGDELQQMVREMQFLRMEGSHREADIMEKEIRRRRQMQMDRVKSRLQDAGQLLFSTGQRVARRTSSAFQQGSSTLSQSAQSYTQRTAAAAAHARRGKKAASGNIYEDPVYEDYHEPQDLLGIAGEGEADGDGRLGGGKRPVGEYSHKSSHGESDEEDLGQNDSHAQSAVCSLM